MRGEQGRLPIGRAENPRLVAEIEDELARAEAKSRSSGKPARYYRDFAWRTRTTWSRARRVIAKAEFTGGEANPRFVVTSLKRAKLPPKYVYEKLYCARGEMENRIKECQLDLYADRTSTATMRANQLRLWFASMAYVLVCAVRRIGLQQTPFSEATCGTIRLKLLKIGALVRISARRIKIAMASGCPAAQSLGNCCRSSQRSRTRARLASLTRSAAARHPRHHSKAHRRSLFALASNPQLPLALLGATAAYVR